MTLRECCEMLGMSGVVTRPLIKKAFRQAALTHHPDQRGSSEKFKDVKRAYDTLLACSDDELARLSTTTLPVLPPLQQQTSSPSGRYDPFTDSDYDRRDFFMPELSKREGFERKLRATGCPHCRGMGTITKNVAPERGFLGLETRLCKCQWL